MHPRPQAYLHLLPEIVKFREMLDKHVTEQAKPLISIPEENMPVVVKLAQERSASSLSSHPRAALTLEHAISDKTALALAKQIRLTLLPGKGEVDEAYRMSLESCLPLPVVEHAIKMIMMRVNYGLECLVGQKTPAAVCIWRWEVQDAYKDWLPKSSRDVAEARLAERHQVRPPDSQCFKRRPMCCRRRTIYQWPSKVSLKLNRVPFLTPRALVGYQARTLNKDQCIPMEPLEH